MNEKNEANEFLAEEKILEVRMYFFVPYNISEIQKGIQAGHASLRYARLFAEKNPEVWDFVDNHETWIILNGGTMNAERDFDGIAKGGMNQIADVLLSNDIDFSYFLEPDLNDGLSALCFLCDEQVFNRKDYPNFVDYLINNYRVGASEQDIIELRKTPNEILIENSHYKEWVRSVGGIKNVSLRELIEGKKMA